MIKILIIGGINFFSLLFTPTLFFKNKKELSLKTSLPFFIIGISIASITIPYKFLAYPTNFTISSLLHGIIHYVHSFYIELIIFFIEVSIIYICVISLGDKTSLKYILSIMMYISIFLIIDPIYSLLFYFLKGIIPITYLYCIFLSIIETSIIYIWKSYCTIIGLTSNDLIKRKNAIIGTIISFSFFYIIHIYALLSIIS